MIRQSGGIFGHSTRSRSVMRVEDHNMRTMARRLDPRQYSRLRRGPLSHRAREPRLLWRNRAGVLLRVVMSVVLLAGVIWAGSL